MNTIDIIILSVATFVLPFAIDGARQSYPGWLEFVRWLGRIVPRKAATRRPEVHEESKMAVVPDGWMLINCGRAMKPPEGMELRVKDIEWRANQEGGLRDFEMTIRCWVIPQPPKPAPPSDIRC